MIPGWRNLHRVPLQWRSEAQHGVSGRAGRTAVDRRLRRVYPLREGCQTRITAAADTRPRRPSQPPSPRAIHPLSLIRATALSRQTPETAQPTAAARSRPGQTTRHVRRTRSSSFSVRDIATLRQPFAGRRNNLDFTVPSGTSSSRATLAKVVFFDRCQHDYHPELFRQRINRPLELRRRSRDRPPGPPLDAIARHLTRLLPR